MNELYHHGVKGQKWGVKNGPPYPVNSKRTIIGTKELSLTADILNKYKEQYKNLSHVDVSDTSKGRLYVDKDDKVVGMINTNKKSDGVWIQGLEVFGDNQGKGIGKKLLDIAVKDFGATKLSVRNTNKKAKHIYDEYGFKEYNNDGYMSYMEYDKTLHHSELYHHGVKGQKWGVRRYQNPDGTLTDEGRKRNAVSSIMKSMTDKDLYNLGYSKKDIPNARNYYMTDGASVVNRIIIKEGKTPVSFLDLEQYDYSDGTKIVNAIIGTRSGDKYRGKGYASKAVKEGLDWYNSNKDKFGYSDMNWGARSTNKASQKLAEKHGFKKLDEQYEKGWVDYSYKRRN